MRNETALVLLLAACGTDATTASSPAEPKAPVFEEALAIDVNGDKADSVRHPTPKGELAWEEVARGRLSRREGYHGWIFDGFEGDEARLDLIGLDGEDTYLLLYGQNAHGRWRLLSSNDDCRRGTLDSCLTVTLPSDGPYLVVVSTWQAIARRRHTAASYELMLSCASERGCGPRGQGLGATCGGIAALQCADGLACDYSENDGCYADAAGTCERPVEVACAPDWAPVCGCDGHSYGNDCLRRAAGVGLDHGGECAAPGRGEGETCGGIANLQCAAGLICDYSGTGCFADAAGVCALDAQILCTIEYNPVCGCDGVTYSNDCLRRAAHVGLGAAGACH